LSKDVFWEVLGKDKVAWEKLRVYCEKVKTDYFVDLKRECVWCRNSEGLRKGFSE
jgi:hypothetical protein